MQLVEDKTCFDQYNEETIQEHFYAPAGLEAYLIRAGVMDPETKMITDARRLLSRDECPQFIAFCTTKGGGKKLVAAASRWAANETINLIKCETLEVRAPLKSRRP